MDKKWTTNMTEMSVTKQMLEKLREGRVNQAKKAAQEFVMESKENDNYLWIKLSANIKKVIIKNQEFQDVAVEMPQIKYIYKYK